MTQVATIGDTVLIHYTGTFEDGSVFDSSNGREPLKFKIGSGHVIKGFDSGITGMTIGEKKSVTIAPEEAYGPVIDAQVVEFPKDQFPEDVELKIGTALQLVNDAGHAMPVKIVEVLDDTVKLDANHPLAGKTLCFDMELIEICEGDDCIDDSGCGDSCGGGSCGDHEHDHGDSGCGCGC